MKAINLRTEYLKDPMGIDINDPRLLWNCEGGKKQTAYRIAARTEGKTVWDSGKVMSSSMRAEYPQPPKSRQKVEWSVTLWDENDKEGERASAAFEYGLLKASDWQAGWISGNYRVNKRRRYPVDCFQKAFNAAGVKKARLYAAACGLYEVKINGGRAGNFVLAPGHTDYTKRIQYQTYDVTDLIQSGANTITAELADGWYRGSCGAWGLRNQYGTQTKLLVQLELTDEHGNITRICTDESWAWSSDGPITFADNKDGEIVDARKKPTYSGNAKIAKCKVVPSASNNVALTEHEQFKNPKVITTPKGNKVLDFGQNIAGYIAFTINAKAGQRLKLRFGEMFDAEGEFTQKNIQCATKKRATPLQQVIYTCKDGVNKYKTKFAIFGFQYVLVEGDAPWKAEDFTAIAVYSDMEQTIQFDCSHPLIDQFVQNTLWSAKNNHADVPTDCPTRERHGWTGDAQIFVNTASYLFDYDAFGRKYIADMCDGQHKNGCFRQITPRGGIDFYMNTMDGSVGWACAGVYIPLYMYQKYGDKRILEENYEGMLKYANFMIKRAGKWGGPYAKPMGLSRKNRKYAVNCGQSYGEWAEPHDVCAFQWYDLAAPHPEESTAYTCFTLRRVLEVAEILGKKPDERLARIKEYSEGAKRAYQELVTKPKFTLDTDRQAKLVRPLYMGLLNKEQEEFAKKRLIQALEHYGWRLGTGFLSTPLILDVLVGLDIGYAYRLLENEQMPGWLFMPKNGATTIWESWEGNMTPDKGIASLNHYSKGAVCEWLMRGMCGIRVAGENKFVIAPKPGGSLTYAKAEYQSVYGKVACGWQKTEKGYTYAVTVPANCTAEFIPPDGCKKTLAAGEYTF